MAQAHNVKEVDVAIVGSGPCGLGAAWRMEALQREGADSALTYVIVDKKSTVGGWASSISTAEGFTFDFGNHVLFPHKHYRTFVDLVNSTIDDWVESIPIRGIWVFGKMVPYPIQRNLQRLPLSKMLICLAGLIQKKLWRGSWTSQGKGRLHFADYLEHRFGGPLTRLVLAPLNSKMWGTHPSRLNSDWAGHRSGSKIANVADTNILKIIANFILQRDDPGWANTVVRYPRGGTGAIWEGVAANLSKDSLELNASVERVDSASKRLVLRDGRIVKYRHLISTMPIDILLKSLSDQPALQGLATEFLYSTVALFGFGLEGRIPKAFNGVHSFQVPELHIPFWRVTLPSNVSPYSVPDPGIHWSVLCEASLSNAYSNKGLTSDQIEQGLKQIGLLTANVRIISRWQAEVHHGYPVPFLGRDELLHTVQAQLRELDILSRGRFGGWKYEVSNQDHSFMQGVEAVEHIVFGKDECTYVSPFQVNNR